MSTLMSLLVKLGVDSGELVKGLDDAEKKTTNLSNNLGKGMQKIGGSMAGLGAAMSVGITLPIISGLTGVTRAAMESEAVMAELDAVLLSTAGAAGVTKQSLIDQANALEKVTKFDGEAILTGQSMLLTFTNIGKDVFPQATEAMLNMVEKFGSMDEASIQLGKALNDPIAGVSALRRVGVMLTGAQEDQIKQFMAVGDIASAQGIILKELGVEFGGLAEAAGATTEGKLTILKNSLGNMSEEIGTTLLPVIIELSDMLMVFLSDPAIIESLKTIALSFGELALSIAKDIMPKAKEFLDWLSKLSTDGKAAIAAVVLAIAVLGPILGIVGVVIAAIGTIIGAVGLTVFALIAAFGALVATIVIFGKDALNTVVMIGAIIGAVFTLAWNRVSTFFSQFISTWTEKWQAAVDKVKEVVNSIKSAFDIDWGTVGRAIIEGIKNGIQNGIGAIADAARNAARAAYEAAKGFLNINSPSKLFAGLGAGMIEGMQMGVDESPTVDMDLARKVNVTGQVQGAGNGSSAINFGGIHITVSGNGDPEKIGQATQQGVMQALRAAGLA